MRDGLPISETGQQRHKGMTGGRCATLPSRKGAVYHSHAGRRKTLDDIFGRSLAASALSPGVERALAASRALTFGDRGPWQTRPCSHASPTFHCPFTKLAPDLATSVAY